MTEPPAPQRIAVVWSPEARADLRAIARDAAMLDPDDAAGSAAHERRELIEALDHTRQIVFRRAVEQTDLHVDDHDRVHGGKYRTRPRRPL